MAVGVGTRVAAGAIAGGGELGAQGAGDAAVFGIGDRHPTGPDPLVGGHDLFGAGDRDQRGGGDPFDEPADRARVDRVVVAVDAHVVVAGEPDPPGQPHHRRHRRQLDHPRALPRPPRCGVGPDRAQMSGVGHGGQPGLDLGVEVERRDEAATGQERGLEVAVAPLDQPLGLRVPRRGELDPHAECPGERGRLGAGLAGAADRALAVPHQRAGTAAPPADDLPHPGQDVPALREGIITASVTR